MKKTVKIMAAAAALLIAQSASAQFANSTAQSGQRTQSARVVDTDPYNRLSISYNPLTFSSDVKGADDFTADGFALSYIHGFNVSSSIPLFIETGVGVSFNFKSVESMYPGDLFNDDAESKNWKSNATFISAKIPVNVAYKFTLNNPDVSIVPFVGITAKYNVIAKFKRNWEGEGDNYYEDDDDWKESLSLFDKDDMGGDKDTVLKRFQFGWNIGAGLNYKALYVGLQYGSDFTKICKKVTTSNWSISLGYNF